MIRKNVIVLYVIFAFPIILFAQNSTSYHKEELNVINQHLLKMIDYSRLKTFGKSILFFNTKMINNPSRNLSEDLKDKNKLLDRLLNGELDSSKIKEPEIKPIPNLEIIFENNNYNLVKYENEDVIGTLTISRISFNKSMSLGYFYYELYCGEDCGWSEIFKVEKKNEKWLITDILVSAVY